MASEGNGGGLEGFDFTRVADYELGEDDIRKMLGNVRIITYPELAKETLQSLFPNGDGLVVILFLTESKVKGHWTCLSKKGNNVEYFDSYGIKPDGERAWLDKRERIELGEVRPLVHELLQSHPGPVYYNEKKLQKGSVATCGRHVVVRGWNLDLPISTYSKNLIATGNPDLTVCEETFKKIGK
jgi:hypothetical protein